MSEADEALRKAQGADGQAQGAEGGQGVDALRQAQGTERQAQGTEALRQAHGADGQAQGTERQAQGADEQAQESEELLAVQDLHQHFARRGGLWARLSRGAPAVVKAVDGVSLAVRRGETVGLVGESGCGKSTLSRCAAGLYVPTSGSVRYAGERLRGVPSRQQRRLVQMVFQDPYSSLNPRMTVGQTLGEVLRYHRIVPREQVRARVRELVELVGLPPRAIDQLPRSFSGGQRQRIGIARALALEPKVLIADEPVSALDVSVQANIINLLLDLKETLGLSMLFVSHNMAVVRQVSDRIAVMHDGVVVEEGPTADVFARPQDAYTQLLLSSVPRLAAQRIPAVESELR